MTSTDQTVSVLNELIQTSEDGKKGFQAAAEKAADPSLKNLFQSRSQSCAAAVNELQQIVRSLGVDPKDSGTVSGAMHRGWVKVKAAVGDNNVAVLEEVERGEDVAKEAYLQALRADLPTTIRDVVSKQYEGVLQNHNRVRDLRNQYRASASH
jgi:uncharacterized protein (TIGR02284 family)